MPIRLSGINSGLDTDALVKELVSAYSLKTEKYEKQKTKVEWKKDAWQGLNTKIYGLYTSISNLRYDSAYNLKKTSVSDPTKAKITASGSAITGTQKLQISSTAQAAYLTSGKLGADVTGSTKIFDLIENYEGGATQIEVKGTMIDITAETTISELVKKLKDEAGLNASFDENNKRFFISAKESGLANDFDLCATDDNSREVLSALGLDLSLLEYDSKGNKVFTSAASAYKEAYDLYEVAGGDIDTYIRELVSGYKDSIDAQQEIIDSHKATIESYKDIKNLETMRDARTAYDAIFGALTQAGIENLDKTDVYSWVKTFKEAETGYDEEKVKEYLTSNNVADEKIDEVVNVLKENITKVNAYEGELSLADDELNTINDQITEKQTAYDNAKKATDAANAEIAKIKASKFAKYLDDEDGLDAEIAELSQRALDAKNILENEEVGVDNAIKIAGQDATIIFNGAVFTSSTNSFSINGLTIEAQAVTESEISITTAVDTQGIYDKIKDFLTQYNSVINEITKLYNADTAKGYEPLTDEERDAMSDTEIEKWEAKIKDSLLRRDSSLGSIMNAMINSMSQSYEAGGQKLTLSNFGISTLGFLNAAKNEQYAFHIDGDEDDTNTSGKEDKLMKAIQENPDQIMEFMKNLTSGLYSAIDEKMKSTELSSVYKVYNDKEIDKEIKSVEELIKKWKEKVEAEEDRYYKQFSQMEVALSKLQSQTNSLAGLLGQ